MAVPLMYKTKNIAFSALAVYRPDGKTYPLVYAAGSDKSIREISVQKNENDYDIKHNERRYEENTSFTALTVAF
jgi:hypothetical protein